MSISERKKFKATRWIIIVICSLLIAWIIRSFLIESFRMPSSQMENTILPGDYILVNKTAYGIQIPPFMSVFSGYALYSKTVGRNDVVLYKYEEDVMISRCVGLPGDTLEVKDQDYLINGNKLPQSPQVILPYEYPVENDSLVMVAMERLGISVRNSFDENGKKIRFFSKYELYLLTDNLFLDSIFERYAKDLKEYKVCIPEGQYWMLSDNVNASADSRHFGYIPQSNLIGKAVFVWFSKDPVQDISSGYRWDRIFHKISR